MIPIFYKTFLFRVVVLALLPGLLLACSGGSGDARKEITEVSEAPKSELPPPQKMNTKDRLGLRPASDSAMTGPAMTGPGMEAMPIASSNYAWALPEGWEDRGATSMRLANLGLAGQPDTECAFSTLGGDGGGLAANLNRWRGQMGLEPYTDAEIEALPRRPLLGEQAVYTVMDGAYGGMGGQPAREDWRLLGLTLIHEGTAFFVKMTGPRAILADQEQNFLAFAESIHLHEESGEHAHEHAEPAEAAAADASGEEAKEGGSCCADGKSADGASAEAGVTTQAGAELPAGHPPVDPAMTASALPGGHPPIGDTASPLPDGHPPIDPSVSVPAAPGEGTSPGGFSWTAPEGWTRAADRPMREVTFTVDGAECYISLLAGPAGGVDANINRWVGQMSQPPLTPEQLKALPTITVLDKQAPLIEVKGAFTGMQGNAVPGQMLLGVVCPLENQTLFVKMTGPEETVAAHAANFVAFCESIRQ